jgi:hypothetical protein
LRPLLSGFSRTRWLRAEAQQKQQVGPDDQGQSGERGQPGKLGQQGQSGNSR